MSWRWRKAYRIDRRQWAKLRCQVLDRDGWRCGKCGRAGRLEVDHVIPLHKGGERYDLENLQALCKSCHSVKSKSDYGYAVSPALIAERMRWDGLIGELSK